MEKAQTQAGQSLHYDAAMISLMVEVGKDELTAALGNLDKAASSMEILLKWDAGLYQAYIVRSLLSLYEVACLGNFYLCSCKHFRHSHSVCKHIAFVFPWVCIFCYETAITRKGDMCKRCRQRVANEAMDNAPRMLPREYKTEKLGRFRI